MSTVPEQILAQARRSPQAIAVESLDDRLTYAQLAAQAGGLADHLRQLGVRAGEPVAVAAPRGLDIVPTLIGVQLSGAAYVPLDPEHPADRLDYILADAGVRILVAADASTAPGLRAEVRVHLNDVPVRTEPANDPPLSPESPAYLIYTSGSTGRPKGVLVTHAAVSNFIQSVGEILGLPDDVALPAVTTFSFDIAGLELYLPLTTGGRVVIGRQHETNDPQRLMAMLSRTGARVMQATPTTWRLLVEAGWSPPAGFTVLSGGERLPAELAERLMGEGVVVWDLYGPTETTIYSAVTRGERGVPFRFYPISNTSLHLLNERLEPVTAGEEGELYIGGIGLAVGYLGRPGLTAARFIADPFTATPGSRLYRTGDIVRRHPDGRIEILGRSDDQVKIRGFRIDPGEIENQLLRHPGVAEAAVRAVADDVGTLRLIGYVRPADPTDRPDSRRLRQHLARTLPAYMIPAQFVVLDAFPRTQNGKLDRTALPAPPPVPQVDEPSPQAHADSADGHSGTQNERRIAKILAEVLELTDVDPHEDFFGLGGTSMLAIQAVNRLNAEMNTQIPLNALFEARTVYGLALLVDSDAEPEPPLVPLAAGRSPRLSSAQWRLWLHQQLTPTSTAYNEPLAVRLPDPLDHAAVESAVTGLLARHDILRTRYEYGDSGQPVPVVQPVTAIRLEVEDGDPEHVLEAELARPFDLAAEPPVRVRLVRSSAGVCYLLMVVHEIAADDRSRELIAAQLRAAYRGRTVATPTLHYADYAEWQRERSASPAAKRHLQFWQAALDGVGSTDLRTDRPRPVKRDWRGGMVRFAVEPAVVDALRDIAHEHDATVSMVLLTAFYGALERYTTGTDLVVGAPVTGRDRPELEDMVGAFVNTVVLRVSLDDAPTFAQLLGRVRATALAAYDHAAAPFEEVVAAVLESGTVRPDPGRNPLFDVMFALHGIGEPAGFPLPAAPHAKIDVYCHLTERTDNGFDGRIEYATQLFDEATIKGLADRFVRLVEEVGGDPSRQLGDARLLDPA